MGEHITFFPNIPFGKSFTFFGDLVIGALRGPIFKVKESKGQPNFFGPKVCEKK